jgi:predicted nucleic acid-binding protein
LYVVDTSVWVSRFVPVDIYHQASSTWLEAQVHQGEFIVAPALLLPELAGAVARRTGLSDLGVRAVSLVQRLPNTRLIPVDAELGLLSAGLAAELFLRGADAVYTALARRLGIPLITWDQEQRQRGQAMVRVVTPQEALRG